MHDDISKSFRRSPKLLKNPWTKTVRGFIENSSEEEIIGNYRPNTLYSHAFPGGRFFEVVHDDKDGFVVKLAARTMLKVVYVAGKEDIEGFHIIKVVPGKPTQRVVLTKFNFQQVAAFLDFIS